MYSLKYALLLFCFCSISFSFAQEKVKLKNIDDVDVSDLTKDLQYVKKEKDNIKMAWWIPSIYWKAAMNGSRVISESDVAMFLETLDDYILVASMHVEMDMYGNFKPKPTKLQLKDAKGNIYEELEESEISSEYSDVLASLKPSMTETLGNFGRQLKFHVFKKTGKDGKLIAPMNQFGQISVLLNTNTKFVFKLPLASTVEEKICPEDNELLNGNWRFCPWHGKKLKLQTK
jgi:hypothetical protein